MKKVYRLGRQLGLIVSLWGGMVFSASAQNSDTMYRAEKLYEIGNYDQALENYLNAEKAGESSAYLNYKIGASYLHKKSLDDKQKALAYLKKAQPDSGNLPAEFWLSLGDAYQVNNEPQQALEAFAKYEGKASDGKAKSIAAERKRKAQIMVEVLGNPKAISLRSPAASMNTSNTEYNPVLNADETVMAYTQLADMGRSGMKEQIMLMYKENGQWSPPNQ
jgi:tetratricopeptide (TPR) repeat protein